MPKALGSSVLAVLAPCGTAPCAPEELGRGLVATPRLNQPIEGFVVPALGTLCLRLWQCPDLLNVPSYDNDLLGFLCHPTDDLLTLAT